MFVEHSTTFPIAGCRFAAKQATTDADMERIGALEQIRGSNGFACALAGANDLHRTRIKADGTRINTDSPLICLHPRPINPSFPRHPSARFVRWRPGRFHLGAAVTTTDEDGKRILPYLPVSLSPRLLVSPSPYLPVSPSPCLPHFSNTTTVSHA
jgi:hypothetical protein